MGNPDGPRRLPAREPETRLPAPRRAVGDGLVPPGRIAVVKDPVDGLGVGGQQQSITVLAASSATPKAAPLEPTLSVVVATPLPPTREPYWALTPVLSVVASVT